jgi:hypothetical protein
VIVPSRPEEEEETVTDPVPSRPVPGPPRPLPAPDTSRTSPFDGLDDRPVAEHVAVYEAEHERLQRELSTVDQL